MTKGVLQGDVNVVTRQGSGRFELRLDIVAPVIDNYRYSVVTAHHGVELYPVMVQPQFAGRMPVECAGEAAFETALAQILSSEPIRRVISALLAQSKAM